VVHLIIQELEATEAQRHLAHMYQQVAAGAQTETINIRAV